MIMILSGFNFFLGFLLSSHPSRILVYQRELGEYVKKKKKFWSFLTMSEKVWGSLDNFELNICVVVVLLSLARYLYFLLRIIIEDTNDTMRNGQICHYTLNVYFDTSIESIQSRGGVYDFTFIY